MDHVHTFQGCSPYFRGTYHGNPGHGKWFKFNDNTIEEFDMNDTTIEAECFGGSYRAKVYDQCEWDRREPDLNI